MTHEASKESSDIVIRIGMPQVRVLSLLLLLGIMYDGQQHIDDFFRGVFEGYEQGQARHAQVQGGFVDSAIEAYDETQKAHR
ncbi:MAG: hypothetical protein ACTHOH_16590 [Lysobacteraceae bacterium]